MLNAKQLFKFSDLIFLTKSQIQRIIKDTSPDTYKAKAIMLAIQLYPENASVKIVGYLIEAYVKPQIDRTNKMIPIREPTRANILPTKCFI